MMISHFSAATAAELVADMPVNDLYRPTSEVKQGRLNSTKPPAQIKQGVAFRHSTLGVQRPTIVLMKPPEVVAPALFKLQPAKLTTRNRPWCSPLHHAGKLAPNDREKPRFGIGGCFQRFDTGEESVRFKRPHDHSWQRVYSNIFPAAGFA
jgi:hypothetical protein